MTRDLDLLVGEWDLLTIWQGRELRGASASFEWVEDGAFLRMLADVEPGSELAQAWGDSAPFPITVMIGADDPSGTYGYLYKDARPVHRIYAMRLDDRDWSISGVAGPEFHQRFVGKVGDDRIDGRWERSADGENWELDFEVAYVRR